MKIGRFPLRLTSCRSDRISCFHVVSDAFFKSKKTATTCSLLVKASLMKVSRRISGSIELRFSSGTTLEFSN